MTHRPTARTALILLALGGGAGCTPVEAPPVVLEDQDPDALTWLAPDARATGTEATALAPEVRAPFDFVVSTENPGARAVRFELDGREAFVCDPARSDDDADCHEDDGWRFTTVFDAPGPHTVRAWFTDAAGRTVESTATFTVQPASSAPEQPEGSDADPDPLAEADLVDEPIGTVVQAITASHGYTDPPHALANECDGLRWEVAGGRVLLPNRAAPTGSVTDVATCMDRYGASIRRYADGSSVSRASVVAALIATGYCDEDTAPERDLVPAAACVAVNRAMHLSPEACRAQMRASPDFAISTLAAYVFQTRRRHRRDPPLVAAMIRRGAVTCTRANAFHLAVSRQYLREYLEGYNAYRTWERHGRRPTACRKRVILTMALYNAMDEPTTNGCWTYERVSKTNDAWKICVQNGELHHASAANWVYDDTNPLHPAGLDRRSILACARGAGGTGYVYMANRGGWQRVVSSHVADYFFAELYSGEEPVDDQYAQWRAHRGGNQPMINVGHVSASAIYGSTLRACRATRNGGRVGVYTSTPLRGERAAAMARALNDCTRR